jgi:DNA-binding MarR family transcriptional regulator
VDRIPYVQYVLNVATYGPAEREFAGRMAIFFDQLGGTRIMGLVYGWLMVCEPGDQSITALARDLGVSKASISTVVRQLDAAQMIERVAVHGTRQHHYRLRTGGWTRVLTSRTSRMGPGNEAAEFGLAHIGPDRPAQRENLEEMRDFFTFLETELEEIITRRWEAYRRRARDARRAAGAPPPKTGGSSRLPSAVAAALKTDSDPPR